MHDRAHLSTPRTVAALVLAVSATLALSATLPACSRSSAERVDAAPRAADPACVEALEKAPTLVLDRPRTPTTVAGTLAWGEPGVLLRCGLPPLGPTDRECLEIDGVPWVIADPEQKHDPQVFTTFGRDPAVEVRVPLDDVRAQAAAALVDVAPVARALPENGRACS